MIEREVEKGLNRIVEFARGHLPRPDVLLDDEVFIAGVDFGRRCDGIDRLEPDAEGADLIEPLVLRAAQNVTDPPDIFFVEELTVMTDLKVVLAELELDAAREVGIGLLPPPQ